MERAGGTQYSTRRYPRISGCRLQTVTPARNNRPVSHEPLGRNRLHRLVPHCIPMQEEVRPVD